MSLGKPEPGAPRARPLDASALKAFAHPLRMQMFEYLSDHGSATATQLARHLGESTGQTSYHLRQLARHGLVEDDPKHSGGRERWWKTSGFSVDADTMRENPATAAAAEMMLATLARQRSESLMTWVRQSRDAPSEWVHASRNDRRTIPLTHQELTELNGEIDAVLSRYQAVSDAHTDEDDDACGHERVRIHYDAFPVLATDGDTPADPED